MHKYRIIRYENYNKNGEELFSKFYIQTYFKIFKWKVWYFVGNSSKSYPILFPTLGNRISFKFLGEAQHFVEDVLVNKKPYNAEIYRVIES